MKILFYVQNESDYGHDTLYDGLCRVLGHENVLEYPHKPNFHSNPTGRYLHYPCLFDYPTTKTDEEKVEMLKKSEFDAIFVCLRLNESGDRFKGKFYNLLMEKSKSIPTFIIDQGDLQGVNERVFEELNCDLYFKRELLEEKFGIASLNYCYSDKYVPENIDNDRTIPLFWAGNWNSYRKKFLTACGDLINRDKYKQDEYRQRLLKSKIGLSVRGFGWDTVRYYEVPAHGAMLFSQKVPIMIPNNFEDGKNAVFFETPAELKDKLEYLLDHPTYVDTIRKKGYEHFKKYHTSTVRARQLLERIGYEC